MQQSIKPGVAVAIIVVVVVIVAAAGWVFLGKKGKPGGGSADAPSSPEAMQKAMQQGGMEHGAMQKQGGGEGMMAAPGSQMPVGDGGGTGSPPAASGDTEAVEEKSTE